jgi:hypothetical protein
MVVCMALLYSSTQEQWHWLLIDLTCRSLNKERQCLPNVHKFMLAIMRKLSFLWDCEPVISRIWIQKAE